LRTGGNALGVGCARPADLTDTADPSRVMMRQIAGIAKAPALLLYLRVVMRACSILRKPPLQQKRNDQDDNRGREDVSASTLVTIDSATRTALHDLVQAPSTHGHWPNDRDVPRCPRRRAPMPTTPSLPALDQNEERPGNCYCSAFPRGSGPCLPCDVRPLRLAEASRQRSRPG